MHSKNNFHRAHKIDKPTNKNNKKANKQTNTMMIYLRSFLLLVVGSSTAVVAVTNTNNLRARGDPAGDVGGGVVSMKMPDNNDGKKIPSSTSSTAQDNNNGDKNRVLTTEFSSDATSDIIQAEPNNNHRGLWGECDIEPIRHLYLVSGKNAACPSGYHPVNLSGSLNGDLNQGAGGKWIYLCYSRDEYDIDGEYGDPISMIKLYDDDTANARWPWDVSCDDDTPWNKCVKYDGGFDYDLNDGAGGKYIYMTYDARGSPTHHGYIKNLVLKESIDKDKDDYVRHWFQQESVLNGDLNEGAGGKDIYLVQERCLA